MTSPEHKYGHAETLAMEEELNSLFNLWNAFVQKEMDSANPRPTHSPPALAVLYQMVLESDGGPLDDLRRLDAENVTMDTDERVMLMNGLVAKTLHYGSVMFSFAQFCVMNGILEANLVQCNCDSVLLADTLEKLMEGTDT